MISMGQLVGLLLAIILPVTVVVVLFLHTKKELKCKGLFVALCYGVVGYLWAAFIYALMRGMVANMMSQIPMFQEGAGQVVGITIISALFGLMMAAGLCWAMYLVNAREFRFEHGATVGLGFSFSYVVLTYALTFGPYLIDGFQIRFGTFSGTEETRQKVVSLMVENLYLAILDMVIVVLVFSAITVVMSHYQQCGSKLHMFLAAFLPPFCFEFFNELLPMLLPDLVSSIVFNILFGLLAIGALWLMLTYLKTRKVMIKPGVSWPEPQQKKKSASGSGKSSGANFKYAGNKKKH